MHKAIFKPNKSSLISSNTVHFHITPIVLKMSFFTVHLNQVPNKTHILHVGAMSLEVSSNLGKSSSPPGFACPPLPTTFISYRNKVNGPIVSLHPGLG